jgi:hypothetical protein
VIRTRDRITLAPTSPALAASREWNAAPAIGHGAVADPLLSARCTLARRRRTGTQLGTHRRALTAPLNGRAECMARRESVVDRGFVHRAATIGPPRSALAQLLPGWQGRLGTHRRSGR